jgi:hypothetical protein
MTTSSPLRERIKQPNSSTCFVCGVDNQQGLGLSFYETSPTTVETTAVIPGHLQGYPGLAHGGIVTALLDEIRASGRLGMMSKGGEGEGFLEGWGFGGSWSEGDS